MYSLFIDTHDSLLVVALYKDKTLIEDVVKESIRNHADFLMVLISELLKRHNVLVSELNEILVINGPGSFTGVRIGVTVAKMLAYTLNINIKMMDSLTMYAISDENMDKKAVLIEDVKGSYGGIFENNELVSELFYKKKDEIKEYLNNNHVNYIVENQIDFNKLILKYDKTETTLAHLVNPIYVKVIDAEK